MSIERDVVKMLDEVLGLNGRAAAFTRDTHLLGGLPELDSMAVVALITRIEEQFGVAVEDDEIDGQAFATVGALVDFVNARIAA